MNSEDSSPSQASLDLLAESFLKRYRRGERPSLHEYTAAYPDLAGEIREFFPALVEIEQLKSASPARVLHDLKDRSHPTRLGDYQILGVVGRGGMGIVYEAVRESLRSRVALKIMHPRYRDHDSYLRRFHIEARAAARLHHTNIVSVFDYGEADGIVYYAMPFIVGHSLEKILDDVRRLRLPVSEPAPGRLPTTVEAAPTRALVASNPELENADHARATCPIRQVTSGLLTGHYRPATEVNAFEGANPGEPTITSLNLAASFPVPGSGTGSSFELDSPADPSSSSLTEKTEVPYFREVARLGAQAADALAYAHKRGILHRDIKPSNLLFDGLGNLWVTDFGLAKFEEGEDLSESRDVVGTLRYMAPERFQGVSGRSSDLYALGATLYEMATLRPAFAATDQVRLIHEIAHVAPEPPRKLDHRIPRDLETIVLKALAKDPNDRFATADEMAAELRRFVDNRPIRSRSVPGYERLWRWCKRNPSLAAVNTLAASLMVVIAVISSWSAVGMKAERDIANLNLTRAYNNEILAHTNAAEGHRMSRRVGQRFEALDEITKAVALAPKVGGLDEAKRLHLRNEAIAAMALPDFRVEREIDIPHKGWSHQGFTLDREFARYALPLDDGTVVVRRLADGVTVAKLPGIATDDRHYTCGFSPDGRYLAISERRRTVVQVWNLESGRLAYTGSGVSASNARSWDFHPDGRQFAVGHADGSISFVDLPSGRTRLHRRVFSRDFATLAFSPDGSQLALGSLSSRKVWICATDSGDLRQELTHPGGIFHVAWNPIKTNILAVACEDHIIYQWDVAAGKQTIPLKGDVYNGLVIAYHPNGELLASRGWQSMLRLWDARTGRQVMSRQSAWMTEIVFDREGRRLAAETEPGKARILEIAESDCRWLVADPFDAAQEYSSVDVDPAGKNIAASDRLGVSLWDLKTGAHLARLSTGQLVRFSTFDHSGALLTMQPWTLRWPVRYDSGSRGTLGPPELLQTEGTDSRISMSRDGQVFALPYPDDRALIFDTAHPTQRRMLYTTHHDVHSVAVSPDGRWVVTGSNWIRDGLHLWDAYSGRLIHSFPDLPRESCLTPIFSPDGRWLIVGGLKGDLLIDSATWKAALPPLKETFGFRVFTPDSRAIAAVTKEFGDVVILDVRDGREVARFEDPEQAKASSLAFSPDGSSIAVSFWKDPVIRVWDLRSIRRRLAVLGLDWSPSPPPEPTAPESRPSDTPLPEPLRVDLGHLDKWLKNPRTLYEEVLARAGRDLMPDSDSTDHHNLRGKILAFLGRHAEAIAEFSLALGRGEDDERLLEFRANSYFAVGDADRAIVDFEKALRLRPDEPEYLARILTKCNERAWDLASKPGVASQAASAVTLARKVIELAPGRQEYLNTLGVALYRSGQFAEAESVLTRSLETGKGQFDAFDLYFLAMSHHRQGHSRKALDCFDAAKLWVKQQRDLTARFAQELAAFRAEAEGVLSETFVDLPVNVFAPE